MNKKNFLKSLMILSVIGLAIIIIPGLKNFGMKKVSDKADFKNQNTRENEQNASGAALYLWSLRANPLTGTIDINDVENARNQVSAMIASAKMARAKSNSLNLQWEELGPDNIGGRTRAILFDKNNPDHMFAGGVTGGLWSSTTHGGSWVKYNDTLASLEVTCITQAANGDIYFGTGEGEFYGYYGFGGGGFPGQGVWKSTDDGATFHRLQSTWDNLTSAQKVPWETVSQIYADPTNPSRIYASTSSGLRATNDGGNTWFNPVRANMTGNQLNQPSTTVKVASDHYVLCSVNSQLYISPNGNDSTFTKVTIIPPAGRVEVAIAPSNPHVMYACVGSNSTSGLYNIYRTTDRFATVTIIGPGGGTFNPLGTQESYANTIAVAPNNPDKIFVAGLDVYEWTPASNWNRIADWNFNTLSTMYVHADQHTIVFNPQNPNDFFIGTDGGLSESQDQGVTFSAMNRNYNVTQCYAVAPSPVQGLSNVIGGTQDNGSLYINHLGNNPQDGLPIFGGDGGYSAISTYNPNAFFYEIYFAGTVRSSDHASSGALFFDTHIDPNGKAGSDGSFSNFITPFILWENLDPAKPMDTSFFIAINGSVWETKKALDFSLNPKWYKISKSPFQLAGQCMGVTSDGKTLFVGTMNSLTFAIGGVYRISNLDYVNNNLDTSGTNYDLSTISTPITQKQLSFPGSSGQPTSISVDPNNGNHVVVTFGSYVSTPHIYVSHNALSDAPTFTSLQGTGNGALPSMPVYGSVIDKYDTNTYIIGTEEGIFTTTDGGTTWTPDLDGFPRVPTIMIKLINSIF